MRSFLATERTIAIVAAGICLSHLSVATADVGFWGLGASQDGYSNFARGVSADGSLVVGQNARYSNGDVPIRWTRTGGVEYLGGAIALQFPFVRGVSGDGSVIGVDGSVLPGGEQHTIFTWTEATGRRTFQPLPGDEIAYINAISHDGSVVMGNSSNPARGGYHAVIWRADGSMQDLSGTSPSNPGYQQVYGWGMSADGNVVVGWEAQQIPKAFRWTQQTGLLVLPSLPGRSSAMARGVSADGNVTVGFSDSITGQRACRWIGNGPAEDLGLVHEGLRANAIATNRDGSVIVGFANLASGQGAAWIWNHADGMLDLKSVLAARGIDLSAWRLVSAEGISADGTTIIGLGAHTIASGQSRMEGWVAKIPPQCRADFNNSSRVDANDILDFLAAWFAGEARADFNGNGLSVQDIFDFLNAWFAGC